MSHERQVKRVSLETAARTFNQFSPPHLIYPETRQVAEGNFDALGLNLDDDTKARLQAEAAAYRQHLRMIRRELGHRTLLCIANDLTQRRESGLYVDSSRVYIEKTPGDEPYDFSAVNWEYMPDGFLSRGRTVSTSSEIEFGAWDIRHIKAASISNIVREPNGHYGSETLAIDDASSGNVILTYSSPEEHMPKRPFYEAFRTT